MNSMPSQAKKIILSYLYPVHPVKMAQGARQLSALSLRLCGKKKGKLCTEAGRCCMA